MYCMLNLGAGAITPQYTSIMLLCSNTRVFSKVTPLLYISIVRLAKFRYKMKPEHHLTCKSSEARSSVVLSLAVSSCAACWASITLRIRVTSARNCIAASTA